MRFKDPKTGQVFEDIKNAQSIWCHQKRYMCSECPIRNASKGRGDNCWMYCRDNPAEAVRLMGYEVVEDAEPTCKKDENTHDNREANMDKQKPRDKEKEVPMKQDKSLSEWTMGEFKAYCKNRRGSCRECNFVNPYMQCHISGVMPSDWDLTDPPRFTAEEIADAKAIQRVFGDVICMAILREGSGLLRLVDRDDPDYINIEINRDLFPGVKPGQLYTLKEIIESEKGD